MARLYADEDFPLPVVVRLRQLGHDVVTSMEAGKANQGISDADQLAFAASQIRVILTRNRRHFMTLHKRFPNHEGNISVTDDPDFDGQAARMDAAISGLPSLSGLHVRVNRPSAPTQP